MNLYRLLADCIVVLHVGYVLFVILGLLAVLVGWLLDWHWVRWRSFRYLHLSAILIVVGEALTGITCPLTTWEDNLRKHAGEQVVDGSFVGRCFHELLFWDAPQWAFTIAYCTFALIVALTFFLVPLNCKKCR